ncbi:MAG: GNAT family N-acetyltransferase [Pseudomonadota bacterium]
MPQVPDIKLETERLILRVPEMGDFEALADMTSDAETMRHITGAPLTRFDTWRMLAGNVGTWALKGCSMFSVVEKESGTWVGRIGLIDIPDWPGTEVGWMLAKAFRGKGYAYEAVAACMDFAVNEMGWTEIIHCIEPANTASCRLAEKLGSKILRRQRLMPPFDKDVSDIWGQTREQWQTKRNHA